MSAPSASKPRRLGLSAWILIGLIAGIATGLFFGDLTTHLKIVGDAFIRLLQMAILPYISISLIAHIGGLSPDKAKVIAGRTGLLIACFWAGAMLLVLISPLAFPTLKSASFFSTAILAEPVPVDVLGMYIPSNPIRSLADDVVPAVVLFSICVGVALIKMDNKTTLIDQLTVLSQALSKVAGAMALLTPIGVFAIAASAAGTMTVEELEKIQAYLISYVIVASLLTFWVLPMAVALLTPFSYRSVLRHAKDPLVLGFTTANAFICLPLLSKAARDLLAEHDIDPKNPMQAIDVALPVVFSFPNAGKLTMLVFLPFAGWFTGSAVTAGELPQLALTGLLTFFGSVTVAVPYMLDLFHIPADMFELFMVTSIVVSRFATAGAVIHMLGIALLLGAMQAGVLKLRTVHLLGVVGITVALLLVALLGTRVYLEGALGGEYEKDRLVREMQLMDVPDEAITYASVPEEWADEEPPPTDRRLEAVLARGELRIGYEPDRIPWSYLNDDGSLVGLDVELAYHLADELGVRPVFVPIDRPVRSQMLQVGQVDVVLTEAVNPDERLLLRFTDSILDVSAALLVPDHLRQEFSDPNAVRAMPGLKIGVPNMPYFVNKLRARMPGAEVVGIDSPEPFLKGETDLDAVLQSAEAASARTLLHPDFSVVVLRPTFQHPIAWSVAVSEEDWVSFLNEWIDLKRKDRTLEKLASHWILGENAVRSGPRWCIARDVLGWLD